MHLSEGILPLQQVVVTTVAVSPFMIDSYRNFKQLNEKTSSRQNKPFMTLPVPSFLKKEHPASLAAQESVLERKVR